MTEAAQKRTPLYDEHVRLGAKIVPFAGWLMPVQYTSIVEEHQAVRNNVGIFDISHMGQLIVEGSDARAWLNTMLTNNIDKLDIGTGQYTFLLNEGGGIIDDLIVYRIDEPEISARRERSSHGRRLRLAAKTSSSCRGGRRGDRK